MKQSDRVPLVQQARIEDKFRSSGHRKAVESLQACQIIFLLVVGLAGCTHSRVIQITITNISTEKISTIMIDYPEATFGINSLDPGKSFRYKIKPTAGGALKIEFRDARGVAHTSSGPVVHVNDEGSIMIRLTQDGATSKREQTRQEALPLDISAHGEGWV